MTTGGSNESRSASEALSLLGQIVVVVPVAHILACSINLIGYTLAFGSNITSLLSFSDLFSITFSGMGTAYILGLVLPGTFIWWIHTSPSPPAIVVQTDEEAARLRDKWSREAIRRDRITVMIGCALMVVASARALWDKPTSPSLFLQGALLSYLPDLNRAFEKRNFTGPQSSVAWMLLSFISFTFGSGIYDGQVDRRSPFEQVRLGHYGCNDLVVLRKVGENYIAARRDNRRLIINADCKTLFQFRKELAFTSQSVIPSITSPTWLKLF